MLGHSTSTRVRINRLSSRRFILAGAMSPVTVAGTVAATPQTRTEGAAEALAGMTLTQLVNRVRRSFWEGFAPLSRCNTGAPHSAPPRRRSCVHHGALARGLGVPFRSAGLVRREDRGCAGSVRIREHTPPTCLEASTSWLHPTGARRWPGNGLRKVRDGTPTRKGCCNTLLAGVGGLECERGKR